MSFNTNVIRDTDYLVCTDDDGVTKKISGAVVKTLFAPPLAEAYVVNVTLVAGNYKFGFNPSISRQPSVIDWGDGTSTTDTVSNPSHTYNSDGTYTVKINTNDRYNVRLSQDTVFGKGVNTVSVKATSPKLTSLSAAFYNCTNLTSCDIPFNVTDSLEDPNEGLSQTFYLASSLSIVPLFNTVGVKRAFRTWLQFPGTSIPTYDTSTIESFDNTFRRMRSLVNFPFIDTSSGTEFIQTWEDCRTLTSFPALDFSLAENCLETWYKCSKLVNFPAVDFPVCTNFRDTWKDCQALVSFPVIDVSKGESFRGTWESAKNLTSFPALNLDSGKDFYQCWKSCSKLENFPPNMFDNYTADTSGLINNSTVWNNAFVSCKLTAQSIENILVSLDSNGHTDCGVTLSGGGNAKQNTWTAAANTALSNLTAKGWTVLYNT